MDGGWVNEKLPVCGWVEGVLLVRMAGGSVDEKLMVCDGWWLGG